MVDSLLPILDLSVFAFRLIFDFLLDLDLTFAQKVFDSKGFRDLVGLGFVFFSWFYKDCFEPFL